MTSKGLSGEDKTSLNCSRAFLAGIPGRDLSYTLNMETKFASVITGRMVAIFFIVILKYDFLLYIK